MLQIVYCIVPEVSLVAQSGPDFKLVLPLGTDYTVASLALYYLLNGAAKVGNWDSLPSWKC